MDFNIVHFTCLLAFAWAAPSSDDDGLKTVNVGGRNAVRGEFPHQVSLRSVWNPRHSCGGAIVSRYWVLTAAHCITTSIIIVKAGKHNMNKWEITEQSRLVARIARHRSFAGLGSVGPYDIALLKLSSPFLFNQYVQPIKLPVAGSEPHGTAMLSGWGSVSRATQTQMTSILQTITLSLMNANTCRQAFNRIYPYLGSKIHSTNVCTAPGNAERLACNGDSGGSLISNNNGVREVIGVVSWGIIPCGGEAPSVYTKVSSFINWIINVVKNY